MVSDDEQNAGALSSEEMAMLASFDAELTGDEIKRYEALIDCSAVTTKLRSCILAMTSSSTMLKTMRRNTPEQFERLFESVDDFQGDTKDLAELAQKAFYRLLVIGSLTEDELEDE